jgi:hypothetical protein
MQTKMPQYPLLLLLATSLVIYAPRILGDEGDTSNTEPFDLTCSDMKNVEYSKGQVKEWDNPLVHSFSLDLRTHEYIDRSEYRSSPVCAEDAGSSAGLLAN